MPLPETKFSRIYRDDKEKEISFWIDQFGWFRDGFRDVRNPDEEIVEEILSKSAVDFYLPVGMNRLSVLGDEDGFCEAYFVSGNIGSKSKIWKVFNYTGRFEERESGLISEHLPEGYNPRLFTTRISPFLQGGIPNEYRRRYIFPLFGSDYLGVSAQIGTNSAEDIFKLIGHNGMSMKEFEIAHFFVKDEKWQCPLLKE